LAALFFVIQEIKEKIHGEKNLQVGIYHSVTLLLLLVQCCHLLRIYEYFNFIFIVLASALIRFTGFLALAVCIVVLITSILEFTEDPTLEKEEVDMPLKLDTMFRYFLGDRSELNSIF